MTNTAESDVLTSKKTTVENAQTNSPQYNEYQFKAFLKEMLNKHFGNGCKANLIKTQNAIAFSNLSMSIGIDSVVIDIKKKCKKVTVNFLVNSRQQNIAFVPTSNNESRYHF